MVRLFFLIKFWIIKKFFDLSNKMIIKRAKKDNFLANTTNNAHFTVQVCVKDSRFSRYMIFKGKEGIEYHKGKIDNPDGEVVFISKKQFYKIGIKTLKTDIPIFVGYVKGKVDFKGNLNVLSCYSYMRKYVNPFMKQMKVPEEYMKC